MAESQADGLMQMLDPFGFWKTQRDAALEAWSKLLIDMVNSQDYARFTGTFLDQYMSMTQPVQDAVQRNMTMALAYVNMPSREEVVSLAERLVNIETRLDDLDAQTTDMQDDYPRQFDTIERRIEQLEDKVTAGDDTLGKDIRSVDRNVEKLLDTLMARLDKLEATMSTTREAPAKPEPKAEPKK